MSPSLPSTFSRYSLKPGAGFDALKIVQDSLVQPKRGEVLIALKAVSLNYRDLVIALGKYPGQLSEDLTPASDGAGEVVAVGEDVSKWAVGDRVVGNFTQAQISGPYNTKEYFDTSLGGQAQGMLTQYKVLPDYGLVRIPDHLSFEEAATLPCAALTAWNSLFGANNQAIGPGQTGVFLGTGGVSVWGAQLALLAGARVIITSSSDSKLETVLKHLGDHAGSQAFKRVHTINYKKTPDWEKKILEITNGLGADHILEVGGSGTLEKSFLSIRQGGVISSIGFVAGKANAQPNVAQLALMTAATLRGILIGSRKQLEDLSLAVSTSELRPLITKVFDFEDAKGAYQLQYDGGIVGKVVIKV